MGASGYAHYLVAVFFLLAPSYVLPQEQEVFSQQPVGSPFDVGPIDSCEVPRATYCIVQYPVPAAIAELTEFIEFEIWNLVGEIRNLVGEDEGPRQGDCGEIYKETLCRKKFPRCSVQDNQVYFEVPENCEERLMANCQNRERVASEIAIKLGYCNSTQLNLYSGSCQRLSSYGQSRELQLCKRDTLVSDWMYEYIRQVDLNLQQDDSNSNIITSQEVCWQHYRNFLCNAVGQCVRSRIQLINTQETCEAVVNCYSDEISPIVSSLITCQPWPSEQQRHRPVTGNSPSPVVVSESLQQTSTSRDSVWVQPNDRTYEFSSSARTNVWSLFTITAVIANVCFV